ncbi:hypothetical protein OsJ_01860 [Oryza sativa Japonica Group]|uniref:Uncharacterized protein n=1 Tax=Oryza sativa subsp. japonica TaxID=39947 RepID=B9EWW0_ORYSJ|nr:hypothetical protein OsJ_01860 [Oryza sativa Japonica Group]
MLPRLRGKTEGPPSYGKDLSDGLRVIATDEDTNVMVSVVRKLPKVLSPQKVVYEKNPAQKSRPSWTRPTT